MTATAAATLAALALSGCISLLPKSKPAQLYRFSYGAEASVPASSETRSFGVLKPPSGFQREASSDTILTTTGSEAAYIGEARWVSPAPLLFDEAVAAAFASGHGPAKLVGRGDARRADYSLRLDVRTFEARYTHGAKSAPDVVVVIDAVMTPMDRSAPRLRTFEVTIPAGDNRVGAIVEAFNKALAQLLPQLTQWVDSAGPAKD
jgi:cholesterol transport system auxiliary component